MKIKFNTLDEMKAKGCFEMYIPSNNQKDVKVLFYDPNEKVKTEEDYLNLSEEEMVDFQTECWECFYDDELQHIPYGSTLEINHEDYDKGEDWFYIGFSVGTLTIPKLPGVIYEEC